MSPQNDSVVFDILRKTSNTESINVDLARALHKMEATGYDLLRMMQCTYTGGMELLRRISVAASLVSDSKREAVAGILVSADTSRSKVGQYGILGDVLRKTLALQGVNIDTQREVALSQALLADLSRSSVSISIVIGDASRRKTKSLLFAGDTQRRTANDLAGLIYANALRKVHKSVLVFEDGSRSVTVSAGVLNDTHRRVGATNVGLIYADTARDIYSELLLSVDALRRTKAPELLLVDTLREARGGVALSADTMRKSSQGGVLLADAQRGITLTGILVSDTLRKLNGVLPNIETITMTISSKTLTDTFRADFLSSIMSVGQVGAYIYGSIKDLPYIFVVNESTVNGDRHSVVGAYDIDDMLSKEVAYSVSKPITAQKVISAIAASLGKTAIVAIDDFAPADLSFIYSYTKATASKQGTAREVISRLFGWTDRVPHRLINVYLRGDKLYVLQRGKETSAVAVQRYGVPTITQKRIRTLLSSTDTDGQTAAGTLTGGSDYSTSQTYYTGTKQYGDASVTYVNGLVVSEVQGGRTTTYTYSASSPPARLVSKQTVSLSEKVVTNYFYTGDDLVREEESIYSIKDGQETLETTKITRYVPLGQGHWGVSVEVDGKIASTNVIRGNPGGLASPFAIETYSADTAVRAPKTRTLRGRYIGDAYIPVLDDATLDAVAAAIEWLDGLIEERVTVDVYDDHIFDLDKRVIFAGAEYYLERNNIMQTPRRFVQRLELVRWY